MCRAQVWNLKVKLIGFSRDLNKNLTKRCLTEKLLKTTGRPRPTTEKGNSNPY
jgi:hypothetical protein